MDKRQGPAESSDLPLDQAIAKTNLTCDEYQIPRIKVTAFKEAGVLNEASLKEFRQVVRHNGELKVKPAWGKNNHIVLTFNKSDTGDLKRKYEEHIATVNFAEPYAAKIFLDAVLSMISAAYNKDQKWLGPNRLHVAGWFVVQTDSDAKVTLEDLMEYSLTKEEAKWRLPVPYPEKVRVIAGFHSGAHPDINTVSRDEAHKPKLTDAELTAHRKALGKELKLPNVPKQEYKHSAPVKIKTPKASPDGKTISAIAASIKMEPGEARRILRANKVEKPYAWKDTAPIIKMLEKGRKK